MHSLFHKDKEASTVTTVSIAVLCSLQPQEEVLEGQARCSLGKVGAKEVKLGILVAVSEAGWQLNLRNQISIQNKWEGHPRDEAVLILPLKV